MIKKPVEWRPEGWNEGKGCAGVWDADGKSLFYFHSIGYFRDGETMRAVVDAINAAPDRALCGLKFAKCGVDMQAVTAACNLDKGHDGNCSETAP